VVESLRARQFSPRSNRSRPEGFSHTASPFRLAFPWSSPFGRARPTVTPQVAVPEHVSDLVGAGANFTDTSTGSLSSRRYTGRVNRGAVQAWIASRRAAEEREREERRSSPFSAEQAIASALALIAVDARLHGWPRMEDPVTRRENDVARHAWVRLRRAWRHR
jgi:hypothetical protein